MKIYKYGICGLLAVLLAACGGGGGNSKTADTTSDGSSTTTGSGTTSSANVITPSVVNTSGTAVYSVVYGGAQRIKIVYVTSAGVAIPYTYVGLSVTSNTAAVTLDRTSALTDSSGVAYVGVSPVSASTVGAATVTITAGTVTKTLDFGISATNVTLGNLTLGSSSLSSGGTTTASVIATANSALATGVSVAFTAGCGTFTPSIGLTDGNGQVSSSYSAIRSSDSSSCSGSVIVSAIASGSTVSNTLSVSSPVASAIRFVGADPGQIYIRGSGALDQTVVKFKVFNETGATIASPKVVVSLLANPGEVGLGSVGSTSDLTLTGGSDGSVQFTVFSGTIPGPIEIKVALAENSLVYAVSKELTVASGPPSQKFFSLGADSFHIEGRDHDGTNATLTVRAADSYGNPVPAGTVVNFIAEGGQVSPSCTIAVTNGIASCSATFSSQAYRPDDMRISVLAYLEGVKEYIDANGNNTFDTGDTLKDMGDAYLDANESRAYDAGEKIIKRGGAVICTGAGGGVPSRENTCTGTLATTVRRQIVLTMSGSVAVFGSPVTTSSKVKFNLQDVQGNPMPDGTTILATVSDNTPDNLLTCTVKEGYDATVTGLSSTLYTAVAINLKDCDVGDEVIVTITTPKLYKTSSTFTIP